MARYLAFAVVAFLAGAVGLTQAGGEKEKEKDKDFRFQGTFTKDDPKDAKNGGPSQTHVIQMKAGKTYTIDLVAPNRGIDPFLRLLDSKGTQLFEDDDGGGGLNSRIIFNCTKDDRYTIVATTLGQNAYAAYTLTVKAATPGQPSTAHALLVGKPAPNFSADFAINGKAGKLADLQGKVVVLCFWEVRSGSSAALLPRLSEWEKTHKAKGLAVVGVTFYPSEINQALVFDDESGGVKTIKKADKKSDRALLEAFSAHHKVGHLLVALPKQDALDAFGAYAVNGLPQVVVIDRKGVVRMVDVGGEKGTANVETEFKKLLAEK